MAALDNIASELLKSANEADLIYKRTRDQAQRDKAVRLRRIVENLRNITLGASDLNGLSDVAISSPTNAQVLSYNSTTLKWQNTTISTATPTLAQVTTAGNTTTNAITVGNATVNGPVNSVFAHTPTTNYTGFGGVQLNVADGTERGFFKLNPQTGEVKIGSTGSGYFTTLHSAGLERMRIFFSSGNVAINTTTDAGYKLDVNGTGRFSDTLLATANASNHLGLIVQPNSQGNAVFRYLRTATTNFATFEFANGSVSSSVAKWGIGLRETNDNDFHFYNHTASKDQLVIKDNTGNVLIGTTTDAGYKLDVIGSGRVKGLDNSSSTTAFLVQNTGGWDNLKVTNDGQVSIGGDGLTTFPLRVYGNSGLQIQVGNALFSYNAVRTIRFLNANNGIPLNHEIVNQVSGTDNSNYVYFRNQTIQTAGSNADWTGISIETIVNTQTSTKVTQLLIKPTYNLQASTTSASIQRGIYYNPTITTLQTAIHRAIETTSGDVIFNGGQVGIGTTSFYSDTKLKVKGVDSALILLVSGANYGVRIGANAVGGVISGVDHTGFGSDQALIFRATKYQLDLGNVLIGTTTDAGYKLDVNGTARVATNLTVSTAASGAMNTYLGGSVAIGNDFVNNGYILQIKSLNTGIAGIYLRAGGAGGYPILLCQDANGTASTTFIVKETGNVGIGTTTPTDKFHIVDNTNGNKFGRISAGGTDASAAWVAQNDQVDNVVYRVFGSAVTGSQMGQALARSASLIANLGGTGKFLIGSFSGTDLIFGTSDQARMRLVDATGNFLIGTMTDTGNKLTVSGNIDAQGYKVNNVLGYTGILNIPTNPPGQQNIDIQGGIVINIF